MSSFHLLEVSLPARKLQQTAWLSVIIIFAGVGVMARATVNSFVAQMDVVLSGAQVRILSLVVALGTSTRLLLMVSVSIYDHSWILLYYLQCGSLLKQT